MVKKMVIEKVMKRLTPHFDHVIVVIQESDTLATMKMEDFIG